MMNRTFPILMLAALLVRADLASAELLTGGQIPLSQARRYGLERSWATALEMDANRDHVVDLLLHISPDPRRQRRVVEVLYENRREVYTHTDVDIYGDVLGKDGVVKRGNLRVNELKARNIEAQTKEYNLAEMTLFAATQRGFVHAIDVQTGATRWTNNIGNSDYPTYGPAANDRFVAVVNGSTLYVLNFADGSLAWSRQCSFVPSAAPTLSEDLVHVVTTRGVVESYYLDDPKRPAWVYQSRGHAMTRPISTARSIAWPTDRGHMYVANADEPGIKYRLEARDSIVAPLTADDGKLFAASADGYVYCVQEVGGAILWRFLAGEPLHQKPVPVGDKVYVVSTGGGMFCISSQNGQQLWWAPRISQFVAASNTRVYCQDSAGGLVILDPQSGGRLGEIPMLGIDLAYVNFQTDRIYLGSRRGFIQCLHEPRLEWPLEHQSREEVKKSKPQVVQEGLDDEPDRMRDDGPEDPFGAPKPDADPFADPFGAPPMADDDDPFGAAPMADDDDPFASPF